MEHIARFIFFHRRLLAAGLAGLATLCALAAVQPEGVTVIVASRDLPSGTVLTSADLTDVQLPATAVPTGAAHDAAELIGRSVGAPIGEGEPLTDRRVLDPRHLDGYGIDTPALSTITLADPNTLVGLRVGDRVDIVSTREHEAPAIVAHNAVIARLGGPDEPSASVVTDRDTALALVAAARVGAFALLARPGP